MAQHAPAPILSLLAPWPPSCPGARDRRRPLGKIFQILELSDLGSRQAAGQLAGQFAQPKQVMNSHVPCAASPVAAS